MKYKVGDKVKVISDLKIGHLYHSYETVVDSMLKYAGRETEIARVHNNATYYLKCDCEEWSWPEETLIPVSQTNANKIRQMTDDELAKIIMCPYHTEPHLCGRKECNDCCLEWLQKQSEEN